MVQLVWGKKVFCFNRKVIVMTQKQYERRLARYKTEMYIYRLDIEIYNRTFFLIRWFTKKPKPPIADF